MDRYERIIGAAGVILAALLLTFGNVMMDALFTALGIQKGRCDLNRFRREELNGAIKLLEQAYSIIENCRDDEQDAYDNLPDSLQDTERGQQMEENADNLDYADSDFENLLDSLREIAEG